MSEEEKNMAMTVAVKKKKKWSREDKIFHAVVYIIFGIFTLLCAYPFYYLLICTCLLYTSILFECKYLTKGSDINPFFTGYFRKNIRIRIFTFF